MVHAAELVSHQTSPELDLHSSFFKGPAFNQEQVCQRQRTRPNSQNEEIATGYVETIVAVQCLCKKASSANEQKDKTVV